MLGSDGTHQSDVYPNGTNTDLVVNSSAFPANVLVRSTRKNIC